MLLRERFQMVLILNDKIGDIVSLLGISPANQDKTKQTNKKCSMFFPLWTTPAAAAATWVIGDWLKTMTFCPSLVFFSRTLEADGMKTRVASHPHSWSHTWEIDNTITAMEAGRGWHGATTRKSNDKPAQPDFKYKNRGRGGQQKTIKITFIAIVSLELYVNTKRKRTERLSSRTTC